MSLTITQTYDLDSFGAICYAEPFSQINYPETYKKLELYRNKEDVPDPVVRISFDRMPKEQHDAVVTLVTDYLKKHPEKAVHFDGCCYH